MRKEPRRRWDTDAAAGVRSHRTLALRAKYLPAKWRKSVFDTQNHVALTAAELATVGEQIKELLAPYQERATYRRRAELFCSDVGFPAENANSAATVGQDGVDMSKRSGR